MEKSLTIEEFRKLELLTLRGLTIIEKFQYNFSLNFIRKVAKEGLTKNIKSRAKKIVHEHEKNIFTIKNILQPNNI